MAMSGNTFTGKDLAAQIFIALLGLFAFWGMLLLPVHATPVAAQAAGCIEITQVSSVETVDTGPCHLTAGFERSMLAGTFRYLAVRVNTDLFDPNRVIWLSICLADPEVSSDGLRVSSAALESPGLLFRGNSLELGTYRSGGQDCHIHQLSAGSEPTEWLFQPIGENLPAFMLSVSGFPAGS